MVEQVTGRNPDGKSWSDDTGKLGQNQLEVSGGEVVQKMSSQDSPWDQQRWSIHHESCVTSPGSDKRLFDLPLKQPSLSDNKDDPALSEWVVGVRWEKTFERDEVRRFRGIFADQKIVCKRFRHLLSKGILRPLTKCAVIPVIPFSWETWALAETIETVPEVPIRL
jgi:hypothetical protein